MDTKIRFNSCVIDSDSLDDWLENDLRQSGILPIDKNKTTFSNNDTTNNDIKLEEIIECERLSYSDESDDKTVVDDTDMDKIKMNTPETTPLSIFQALAILSTLQQHQQQQQQLPLSTSSTSASILASINPLQVTLKQQSRPILPVKNQSQTSPINKIVKKRDRDLNGTSLASKSTTNNLDSLTLKRQKNTDAARRSRLRKVMKMEGLERRVKELEKENETLLLRVATAENACEAAKIKESNQRERMVSLEAQLAEAHQSLLQQKKKKDNDINQND
ncbi:uncharacterized protein BX664DRAFT_82066 [Halteromyces radiatus]|uniref:uncharacterized protein n=1 Tax=Halteromyces radiatus TaxID=101107 RepID=UPI00221F28E0|nr:uncharacterized protein BX664DRAFT_82066 [Halteromyces radiatus]KAI8097553.1 hypothetical protein BX664DRAFT_82066 [Halteromyces radiatus]